MGAYDACSHFDSIIMEEPQMAKGKVASSFNYQTLLQDICL